MSIPPVDDVTDELNSNSKNNVLWDNNTMQFEVQQKPKKQCPEPGTSVRTFCQNSSMRGVPKILKYKQVSLRILWIMFVFVMAFALLFGIISLTIEYLNYNTLINTRESSDRDLAFPSLTICNHHPFKETAEQEWKDNKILSPRGFSESLRHAMKEVFIKGKLDSVKTLFYNDKLASYFETIGFENASKIGHPNCVVYCILQLKSELVVGHKNECGLRFTQFQHPNFFNCYTVSIEPSMTNETVTLGLIVKVGKEVSVSGERTGLMQEIFNQAHGIKVVLHEPNTFPDPVQHGINLETGKFTEMKFETLKWIKASSPKDQCIYPHKSLDESERILDIGSTRFNYTFDLCTMNELARKIRKNCQCYSAFYPLTNEEMAWEKLPYCNAFDKMNVEDSVRRLQCFRNNTAGHIAQTNSTDSTESNCIRRCEYFTYEVHSSTSQWVSKDWQLYWLMLLSDAWRFLDKEKRYSKDYNSSIAAIQEFLNAESQQALMNIKNSSMDVNSNIFFVVSRSSFTTTEKIESLSLTFYALASRIGGISSLTLGVTFATIFEILEFICLYFYRRRYKQKHKEAAPVT